MIDDDPGDPTGAGITAETIATCNQFTIQGDLFSKAIREGGEIPVPLEDAIQNMAAIDAISRSAKSGKWETAVSLSSFLASCGSDFDIFDGDTRSTADGNSPRLDAR